MIQKGLSSLSSTEREFNESIHPYNEALKEAGYENVSLKYEKSDQVQRKTERGRSCGIIHHLTQMYKQI